MIDPAKQIKILEEIAGKKVKSAKGTVCRDSWGEVGILFADGTWLYLSHEYDSEDFCAHREPPDEVMLELGWMTRAEYGARNRAAVEASEAEAKEQRHAEYERLKAEFEGKP